jgi:hypothetical protein
MGELQWLAVSLSPSGRLKTPLRSKMPANNYKLHSTAPTAEARSALGF